MDKNKVINNGNICDSIIYELPEATVDKVYQYFSDKLDKVTFCSTGGNTVENEFGFSFPYDDEYHYTHRDSLLIIKTNRYLKLRDKYFPLINLTDILFANIPKDSIFYYNEFKSFFFTVNARGEFVNGFAY